MGNGRLPASRLPPSRGSITVSRLSAWRWLPLVSRATGTPSTARTSSLRSPPPLLSAGVLAWWFVYLYGRPLAPAADHAGFSGFTGTLNGLAGTFLDQQWGAWIHNPLLVFSVALAVPFALNQRG
ncbi:MAG: hypothetical protein KatS3mg059_0819 [Thermomicrobiales bacterium]|nr:MAG: hypothetical protein KatS3mg059_0819 [Thermomicrobiales bacterium]